jgi:AraC-like DNA-binding protein
MYFNALPDHDRPGFDEKKHFGMFGKKNVVFNAVSSRSHCDDHIGCLSIKTVFAGEEWYGVNGTQVAVRAGSFLVLNDGQNYSCRIEGSTTKTVSVFFAKDFAKQVLRDTLVNVQTLVDDPFEDGNRVPEFFQVTHALDDNVKLHLGSLINSMELDGYNSNALDEHLVFLLRDLVRTHTSDLAASGNIHAIRSSTQKEIYKRICIARDLLHSFYQENRDLRSIATASSLSVPQLVRQFKAAFGVTPHRYLVNIRLSNAAELLRSTTTPVSQIAAQCGFEDASSFSRAFRMKYRVQPGQWRNS